MDEYAREIFDLWFGGNAPREVVFDSPKWANYMRASTKLSQQIDYQLKLYAELCRDQVDASPGTLNKTFTIPFHGELGSDTGGFLTGYNILHGSNKCVGDSTISGQLTAVRLGQPGSAFNVTYNRLNFVFNDIVDANMKWRADILAARVARNMARSLDGPPPRDYTLRIKWSAIGVVIVQVPAFVKGKGLNFLKTFPS